MPTAGSSLSVIRETWIGLLDLVYPPKCLVCGAMNPESICRACRAGFEPVKLPICNRCGNSRVDGPCRTCESGTPEWVTASRAAGRFEGSLRQAILNLKYNGKRKLGEPLGCYLADYLATGPFGRLRFDQIVPVPLHPSRMREREFNQAALIAQQVSKALRIPIVEDSLVRIRRTRPQVELPASERAANVRGAFAVRARADVKGKRILLIDDVVTTLHTADECARVLLDGGAKIVCVASVAR